MNLPEWDLYLKQYENLDHTIFNKIPETTQKYCVIIEPRCHPKLISVIKNFMYLLQEHNWGLIIFYGTNNEQFVQNGLTGWKNVKYIKMNVDNLNIEQYNGILLSIRFWETLEDFGCKHSLIFQTDTLLLKSNIDDFLHYDYVGAPWCIKFFDVLEVGNGGLSLRNVQTMKMLIQKYSKYQINEDTWFSFMLLHEKNKNSNIKVPTLEGAKLFSVETLFYKDPIGLHNPHLDKFKPDEVALFIQLLSKRHVNL